MTTTFIESQGVQLQRGDGASPESFVAVPQLTSLDGPNRSRTVIDLTTLDSIAKESGAGLPDYGPIEFEGIMDNDNTQHQGLLTDFENGTVRNWKIVESDSPATETSFQGFIETLENAYPIENAKLFSGTIRLSAKPTTTF